MAKRTTPKRPHRGREAAKGGGRRRLALAFAGVVAGGAVVYGALELRAWARTSDRFVIEHVDVQGTLRATPEALVRLSGVSKGDNLFAADLDEVTTRVRAHPWVASARVTADWPRGLRIEVVEHDPVVLVALGHLYYATSAGDIVKRYAPGERAGLPVVTGLSRDAVEAGEPESQRMLQQAIAFVAEWKAASGASLSEVNVDGVRGVSFVRQSDPARVEIGHAPWAERLAQLARAERALASRGVTASRIEMAGARRPHRVVVRRGTGAAAAKPRVVAEPARPVASTGE